MPSCYAVPAMRKAAAIDVVGHLRRHVERTNEIAHRSCVRNRGIRSLRHITTCGRLPPPAVLTLDNSEWPPPHPRQPVHAAPDLAALSPAPLRTAVCWYSVTNNPS